MNSQTNTLKPEIEKDLFFSNGYHKIDQHYIKIHIIYSGYLNDK